MYSIEKTLSKFGYHYLIPTLFLIIEKEEDLNIMQLIVDLSSYSISHITMKFNVSLEIIEKLAFAGFSIDLIVEDNLDKSIMQKFSDMYDRYVDACARNKIVHRRHNIWNNDRDFITFLIKYKEDIILDIYEDTDNLILDYNKTDIKIIKDLIKSNIKPHIYVMCDTISKEIEDFILDNKNPSSFSFLPKF